MSSRHRPLLACAVSISAMADIASRKAQDHFNGPLGSTFRTTAKFAILVMSPLIYAMSASRKAQDHFNGPLGSTFRTTAKFAILVMSPLIYAMKYQWSLIIFFLDYQFLVIEKTIELFCPNFVSHVFNNKIEEIVLMIESLPEKFDDAVDKFPAIIYHFSFSIRQWSLVHLISWLNCLTSTLNQMERENSRMKEITPIDNNRNNLQIGPPESSDSLYTIESFCSATQCFPSESYKDVGKILDRIDYDGGASEREENENLDRGIESSGSVMKFRDIGKRVINKQEEYPILQLLESNWLSN